jgi:hypothetical protein
MKQYIVTLLLTGFISVFVCDALCNLGLISWGNYPAIEQEADHHPIKGNDNEHHDDAISYHHNDSEHHDNTASDHHNDNKHEHENTDEEQCCDEIVTNLYASLIKYELKQNIVEIPVFHSLFRVNAIDFQSESINQKIFSSFYANLPPPVSGHQIRIFIQSFLN